MTNRKTPGAWALIVRLEGAEKRPFTVATTGHWPNGVPLGTSELSCPWPELKLMTAGIPQTVRLAPPRLVGEPSRPAAPRLSPKTVNQVFGASRLSNEAALTTVLIEGACGSGTTLKVNCLPTVCPKASARGTENA